MIESRISKKIIKPKNCVLGFGIPTSEASFYNDRHAEVNKDFVKQFAGPWSRYNYEIVSNVREIEPAIAVLGATVVHDLTLGNFGELFTSGKYDVVILFSHWKDDAVEFYDGLADVPAVVQTVPSQFSGLIDLCVCHPESLTIALRQLRPNCLVRYIRKRATPYIWLSFYLVLFKLLESKNLTYLEAVEETVTGLMQ